MAIAFDAFATGSGLGANSITYSHTCTTGARLYVGVYSQSGDNVTGVTYNGVSLTQIMKRNASNSTGSYYWYFISNPASGANNVVVSRSVTTDDFAALSVSYTGSQTSNTPNATAESDINTASSLSLGITTTVDNCWSIAFFRADNAGISAGTGEILRGVGGTSNRNAIIDTDGVISPAGTETLNASFNTNSNGAIIAIAISPETTRRVFNIS